MEIQLIDNLGMVTLSIPLRYDTGFSLIHYFDCGKPCDEQKYRFQPRELPIKKESGFYWFEPKDYIERFTISHTRFTPFHDGDSTRIFQSLKVLKRELASNPENPKVIFDTVQKVNDRYFSIIAVEKTEILQSKKVVAITTIKNNEIQFQYELLTAQKDSTVQHFVTNSIDLIKTIRISKGI